MLQGQYEQAAIIFEERIKLAQELGDEPTIAIKQLQLGDIALVQGNLIQAMTLVRESLVFFRKQNDNPNVAANSMGR